MNTEETTKRDAIIAQFAENIGLFFDPTFEDGPTPQDLIDEFVEAYDGLGVPQGRPEDRSEAKPECGPDGTATPKESVISVEALEKEGWKDPLPKTVISEIEEEGCNTHTVQWLKKNYPKWERTVDAFGNLKYKKGKVSVTFDDPKSPMVSIGYHLMEGVSSMQDLRQLEQLVNGKQ